MEFKSSLLRAQIKTGSVPSGEGVRIVGYLDEMEHAQDDDDKIPKRIDFTTCEHEDGIDADCVLFSSFFSCNALAK
jgi:hypothetical protein